MERLDEMQANLRTAIAFSKKPGNEGQCLANAKGVYRPVAEILWPVSDVLVEVETLVKAVRDGLTYDTASAEVRYSLIREALAQFEANLEPKLTNANAAKAAARQK